MSKSKEDILEKLEIQSQGDYFREDVLKAMDEYAKQEAIAFLDNIRDYERENCEQICYDERTSEELYTLFLQDQSKDKKRVKK